MWADLINSGESTFCRSRSFHPIRCNNSTIFFCFVFFPNASNFTVRNYLVFTHAGMVTNQGVYNWKLLPRQTSKHTNTIWLLWLEVIRRKCVWNSCKGKINSTVELDTYLGSWKCKRALITSNQFQWCSVIYFRKTLMYESYYRLVWTKKTGLECRTASSWTGTLIAKDKKKKPTQN